MGAAMAVDTVPGGSLHMAFPVSIVFASADSLSIRTAPPLLLTALFCLFLHFGSCMPRDGICTCFSGTWNGWILCLCHRRWRGEKGISGFLDSGFTADLVMQALTGLRRRWSVYGVYDNEWRNGEDDGIVETGHSGMQQVTGMSMLSCSVRWSRTLQQES
ncbi:hypothetical protein C7974DRAFT_28004 [Boeremia exigua]|uniref:uncharacterized protein n=1 Tax=Boeremia exigua TaxID=749465 RepID=UPI001E8D9037|nr:uncharacterized protein C7974DRAFT_28004 [Boeremia exigua]KAH6644791.1 hypothetical protein C7974DRAFT_28004 [Boeremia exigua]